MLISPFGNIFGFIVPAIFIFVGIRVLRHFFHGFNRNSRPTFDEYKAPSLPLDDSSPATRYSSDPFQSVSDTNDAYEHEIFKLADSMKGRLTVSDIVIGTDLGLKDAEREIDRMVDGVHVTMEVTAEGRVVYEFPEIIARYRTDNPDS